MIQSHLKTLYVQLQGLLGSPTFIAELVRMCAHILLTCRSHLNNIWDGVWMMVWQVWGSPSINTDDSWYFDVFRPGFIHRTTYDLRSWYSILVMILVWLYVIAKKYLTLLLTIISVHYHHHFSCHSSYFIDDNCIHSGISSSLLTVHQDNFAYRHSQSFLNFSLKTVDWWHATLYFQSIDYESCFPPLLSYFLVLFP